MQAIADLEALVDASEEGHTKLINVTPICSEQEEVLSVVVTMQDMTPLEEQEGKRAEFHRLVSQERKMPLATIKGCATTALTA